MSQPVVKPEYVNRVQELAQKNGVSTTYWDWHGNLCEVAPETLVLALRALGNKISLEPDAAELDNLLRGHEEEIWLTTLPACTIKREGNWQELHVHVPSGESLWVEIILEDGHRTHLNQIENWDPDRPVHDQWRGRASFALEQWIPTGYHTLVAHLGNGQSYSSHLIVVPNRIDPPALHQRAQQWGVSSQLYSVRSQNAWGMGDAKVLAELNEEFGKLGADFHLVNPMHSASPVTPIQPSPYLPVTRQFLNPLYIYPESIAEYAGLTAAEKAKVERLHKASQVEVKDHEGLVNRDAAWTAKVDALRLIFAVTRTAQREAEFEAYIEKAGLGLSRYATWCVLAETYGKEFPADLASAHARGVAEFAASHTAEIRFHMWCQWIISQQLDEAQRRALDAGMGIGVMSDLAVGVDPEGSEVWSNPEMFASGMTVGAPPDMYSQLGQNWSQPPWNPRALAASGYAPLRSMIRAAVAHAGAVRIDHILGLFRLWWIPEGKTANFGCYIAYEHEAMVGVLLLEAQRAGTVVIGEDLGTVEPWVRGYLNDRGILGTSILWFEREDDNSPMHADHYRVNCMSAVNTHDLPPTVGYLRGVQTTLRDELGLLVEPVEDVRAADKAELDAMLDRLHEYGMMPNDKRDDEQAVIDGLYRYIARTDSKLLCVSLVDMVGDARPQNLPGTYREYPNWEVPLTDSNGDEVLVEDLGKMDLARFAQIMNEGVGK
ncbi:4-alpha-glucanotransferase [Gleimia coleocanis DSM 15436]|uniref:4-alpha-glucanotransferase n=1 Tax=Gleimia coleocanis DSM 15436 TaxID=525245 RepID=C0W1C2_9ACTO|nr:4-alpha-glucanotransferase [Gleimia coleocanis]EEH63611.1 4-alpha-glucanotransferase [Gleimia coleocanis DSM 15436]